MPTLSHIVYGTIKDIYGIVLSGAVVSLKHTLQDQTIQADELTDSNGNYRVNLAKLDSQWSKGEEIQVTASKSAEGTKTETTTIQGTGNQIVNITLTETSDLTYYENARDSYTLNFALLTHYDGEKVTRERPLPVCLIDTISQNLSFPTLSYDSSGNLTMVDNKIGDETYRLTLTYDSSDNLISVSNWVRQ